MKPILIAFFIICVTTLTISCRQTNSATLDYRRLNYDTNKIAIFKWDTTKYQFPTNSDPLPLTQEDLRVVDSLLKDAVDSFNTQISPRMYQSFDRKVPLDSFILKQEKYKYQYFPFKDVNGQRVMTIIGFSADFQPWKKEVYQPRLHYGMKMLDLKINLSEKIRDNIRSGDFG
jgi:hypothetical protein